MLGFAHSNPSVVVSCLCSVFKLLCLCFVWLFILNLSMWKVRCMNDLFVPVFCSSLCPPGVQDDLDRKTGSGAILGLDAGLEELLLAMQKNVTNQVPPPWPPRDM